MKMLNPKHTGRLAAFMLIASAGLSGAVQATTTASQAEASGLWKVESGQWLGRIVAALESDPTKRLQLMELIVFQNPHAFINADPNRMLAGAELKLPGATVVVKNPSKPGTDPVTAAVQKESVSEVEKIGRITSVRGQLTATGKNGQVRALRRRSYVRQGDTLATGIKGGAQVKFNDGAQIALRRNSELRIDEYRWEGNQDGKEKAVMSLVKGGFRTITGAIGKLNKTNYRVNSPYATIGIRGTHYALMSCQGGSCAGLAGGDAPDDGLYGGTAFGAIIVDENHVIEPQQYFHHDGSNFRALMGPPSFLFGSDTQVGDASGSGEGQKGQAQGENSEKGQGSGGKENGGGFAAGGGAESGGMIAQVQKVLPGQEGDGIFSEGDDETAEEALEHEALLSGSSGSSLVATFDASSFDLLGDLSNLSADLTSLLGSLGAANVQVIDTAAFNGFAYVAQVFPFGGLFEASDSLVDSFGVDNFFIVGDFGGKTDLLLAGIENDAGDLGFFFGPTGSPIASQSVSDPAFTAHIGRWDSNIVSRFFEPSDGDTAAGVDFPLATEFGYSLNRTPSAQLLALSGLGSAVNFSSVHGFGSDELGQGFSIGAGDIQFDVNFVSQTVDQGFLGVTDNQGRIWNFFGSALGVSLENDFLLNLSGSCSGCASGSSAEAFIFATFLGAQAEGALGSFGAQTGTLSVDAQEAIAGIGVYKR